MGVLNLTVYPLSSLVPRDERRWAFGHQGGQFAGNAKYLYLWLSIYRPDIKASWITSNKSLARFLRSEGYRSHSKWSFSGMMHALRSSAHLFDHSVSDVNLLVSCGAKLINLWHGVGLKATQFGDSGGVVSRHKKYERNWFMRALFLDYLKRPSIVVTTSFFMQEHFSRQFDLPRERCPKLGYPRLDPASDAPLKAIALDLDRKRNRHSIDDSFSEQYVYLPTYRDTERSFLEEALPDFDRLSEALSARNAVLYVKLHPRTAGTIPEKHSNIRSWPPGVDFYAHMHEFDILITDYSSVLYDYLFVRRHGAILYTFDLARYLQEDRLLLYPYEENVAGVRTSSFEDLCAILESGRALHPSCDEQVQCIRDRFWSGSAAPASPGIVRYVEALVRGDGVIADPVDTVSAPLASEAKELAWRMRKAS
ncbi:MAG: CDP-glycerol glycerophosphotransferase family protein [Sphingobium sp.]|uniref:CDP-glycerol glycerophosphotransferase family protein n=1 Tax=Sphingobium sp. TaxID=1912891 RepID=UPI0029BDEF1A|nr:CDP-glycerol glycerophosphotransferase family protein [Sphingobium sp.]MDX3911639.1 CDP-glycerol glycerophosphotransferase family protein [Sphingobium sp.]